MPVKSLGKRVGSSSAPLGLRLFTELTGNYLR
jgi:hypothetical protein